MDTLHVILFSLLALAVAAVVVVVRRDKQEFEIAVHKWAARIATAFSKAGLSSVIVKPFQNLAAADDDAALGTGITAAEYLEHPENWTKELLNMIAVGLADPVIGPKIRKFFTDELAGADQATLKADADDVVASSALSDVDKANAALEDSVHQILNSSAHPELAPHIDNLPAGQKFLAGLMVAGKNAAQQVAAVVTPAAAPALAAIPDGHILLGPNATLPTTSPAPSSSAPSNPSPAPTSSAPPTAAPAA